MTANCNIPAEMALLCPDVREIGPTSGHPHVRVVPFQSITVLFMWIVSSERRESTTGILTENVASSGLEAVDSFRSRR